MPTLREPISIIIPAYNESEVLAKTLNEIKQTMTTYGLQGEIIVVDDGSTDNTVEIGANFREIRLLQHQQNKGYGATLKTGIRRAKYENIVIIDADGTYPSDEIQCLVSNLDGYDMVVGARTGQKVEVPLIRRPAKWLLGKLANYLSGIEIPDLNSGLRVFRREVIIPYFRMLPSGFSFTTSITLIMLTNDYNVLYMPIDYRARSGKSKIRPVQDTINFFSLVVRVILSYRPLRIFVPLALIMGAVSLLKAVYDIIAYDLHIATSTVVLLTITFQIIILGLIADLVVSLHKS